MRGGITRRMYEFAKSRGSETIPVLLEGPYGGIDSSAFDAFDRFFFIAGGSGGATLLPLLGTLARKAARQQLLIKEDAASAESLRPLDVQVLWAVRSQGEYPSNYASLGPAVNQYMQNPLAGSRMRSQLS